MLRLATRAMGTRFELVLDGEDETGLRAAGEAAIECIERCDARFSAFSSSSLVARVNRDAARRPVQLDHELFALLERCLALSRASDGAFDVAVGPLLRALGFRGPREDLAGELECGAFELDRPTRSVRFTRAETALDLGSIAKGHALDLAVQALRENGVSCALLHGGTSSVIALGHPPSGEAWRVRIGADGRHEVRLADAALSVSAPRGRTTELAGQPVGHILDPRSARPVPLGWRAAVVGPSASDADAWSTAALVLRARGSDLASVRPREQSWLLEDESGDAFVLGPDHAFAPAPRFEPTPPR